MTDWQRWRPFAVLCGLVTVSVAVGALLPQYRQVSEWAGIGIMANAILYAVIVARPKEP